MKLTRSTLTLTALQLLLAATAHAQTGLEQIKAAGVFKIGTEGTYAPYTFHNASGTLVGFDVEIGQAIAKRLGVKAQFVEGKWDGLIAGLDANRYDAVINQVAITEARKAKYDFSNPYITSRAVLIVRSDNTTIKRFSDLKGKKSANALASNLGKLAQDNGAELVNSQSFSEAIDLLTSGRVDAAVNDGLSFLDLKKQKPDVKVKVAATAPNADYSGVIIRKGNPELQAAINQALAGIKADGTYLKISRKYFGADVSQ
ncbi:amino acid ABC transporter substrate-binding protein [Neisseriaceae bacterium JH1-16]|nr:amino acid ABC transporter substrate-binding protein [Neisseriaceae bacterium JH1-16]